MEALAALKTVTGFTPLGEPAGNLTLGKGVLHGQKIHLALMENRIASGSLGVLESDKLASLCRIVAVQKTPLLLYLDSAGARLNEGLPALGAFRRLFRAACDVVRAGTPFGVVLGANCYGGASMLAALAGSRFYSDNTQLAMSGPSILAQAAGGSALDEMFRAIAQAAIGCDSRVKAGLGNLKFAQALPLPVAADVLQRHRDLKEAIKVPKTMSEPMQRKDLTLLYPGGYELQETDGVVHGEAQYNDEKIAVLGLVNRKPLGAATAWLLAERAWQMAANRPARLHVVLDCDAHSAQLDDERVMLSAYIVDIAVALGAVVAIGIPVDAIVLGTLGGGAYVATAASAQNVNIVYGANIQLLPGKAIASILGDNVDQKYAIGDYVSAGVAEKELRIGMVPSDPKPNNKPQKK